MGLIRVNVKWIGLAVAIALLASWITSEFLYIRYMGNHGFFGISYGSVEARGGDFDSVTPSPLPAWRVDEAASWPILERHWWFENIFASSWWSIRFPIWIPLFVTCAVTAIAWRPALLTRFKRCAPAGICPKCNYDRRGLDPAAPCPECGET